MCTNSNIVATLIKPLYISSIINLPNTLLQHIIIFTHTCCEEVFQPREVTTLTETPEGLANGSSGTVRYKLYVIIARLKKTVSE